MQTKVFFFLKLQINNLLKQRNKCHLSAVLKIRALLLHQVFFLTPLFYLLCLIVCRYCRHRHSNHVVEYSAYHRDTESLWTLHTHTYLVFLSGQRLKRDREYHINLALAAQQFIFNTIFENSLKANLTRRDVNDMA